MNHLRGKLRQKGRTATGLLVWEYEVVNENTGKVFARDGHCDWAKCVQEVRDLTITARHAWMVGIKAKDLRP